MSYGELKIDTLTFTAGGVDASVSVSGLVQNPTFTGNITTTGTISGDVVRGNTVSGATVTGDAGEFGTVTGNTAGFTTVTGTTVTGTTANFATLSGTTVTGTTANFVTVSGTTVTGDTGQFTNITGVNIVGTTEISGATVTGDVGRFTTITGGVHTLTSGVFASGTAANPSITFVDDLDTGLFTEAANTVSLVSSGESVLTVSGTRVGINTTSPSVALHVATSGTPQLRLEDLDTSDAYSNVSASNGNFVIQADPNGASGSTRISFEVDGGEVARFTESNRLLIGSVTSYSAGAPGNPESQIQNNGTTYGTSSASLFHWQDNDANAAFFTVNKSRGGLGTQTTVSGEDRLGGLAFAGSDGTNFIQAARIEGEVDGTPGTNDMPGRLVFATTADGDSTPTEAMRIDSSGRLLINGTSNIVMGSNNPTFQVQNTGGNSSIAISRFSNDTAPCRVHLAKSRGTTIGANGALNDDDEIGNIRFHANDGTDFAITAAAINGVVDGTITENNVPGRLEFGTNDGTGNINTSTRMTIDSAGRVLIGTTNAWATGNASLFQIQSSVGAEVNLRRDDSTVTAGAVLGSIRFWGNDGDSGEAARIQAEADGTHAAGDKPGRIAFLTSPDGSDTPADRMVIKKDGMILINTGSTTTQNDTARLVVQSDSGTAMEGIYIRGDGGAGDKPFIVSNDANVEKLVIYGDGDVQNTNGTYGTLSSDERLKQDIVDISSQWDDIKGIRLTKFRFRNDPDGILHLGPIAQELETVCPGLITRRPASRSEVADPSNNLVDGDEVLGLKTSIIYMKAVGALQEAMERIETLEAKVAALEGN